MFNYEWFAGPAFRSQCDEARWRCALRRFPNVTRDGGMHRAEFKAFWEGLRTRTLVYLRDGFSYELKDLADVGARGHLTFECEPVDEQYKVGAFVISVPYEDVVRVEVFAVPPEEMPDDMPAITGFRTKSDPPHSV